MRTLNDSSGAAEYWTTSAPSIVSCKSGMHALLTETSSLLEPGKKRSNFAPDFRATGKAAPVGADQPDQLVAFIDWNQVILGRGCASNMADAINEQGGHIVVHVAQNWIHLHDVSPGV